jgi:hypothetical protein
MFRFFNDKINHNQIYVHQEARPCGHGIVDDVTEGLSIKWLERIETGLTLSFLKQLPCCPILYEIISWMKF